MPPETIRSWMGMALLVAEDSNVKLANQNNPRHKERLHAIISAICWYAPGVDISLETVRSWVQDSIDFRSDMHAIFHSDNPPNLADVWAQEPNASDGGTK
jgi:hypothetical protein